MELYEAMSTLRAVRRLRSDPVPDEVLERVLQAAAWAPSGGNVQPFRILAVKSAEKLKTIQKWYREEWDRYIKPQRRRGRVENNDAAASANKIIKAGDYLANHLAEVPVLLVFCFNPEHMAITDAELDRPSVVGGGSVYTAVQNVMLACRQEGLGCVLTTLLCHREQAIKLLLEIPEAWGTCAHIPIGYPVLRGHGPISRRPVAKLVFENSWGQPMGKL